MADGFIPFEPRPLARPVEAVAAREPDVQTQAASEVHEGEPDETQIEDTPAHAPQAAELATPKCPRCAEHRCEREMDAGLVRAAAISVAASACARALRYAIDRNPRLIARFVDDALAAAGVLSGVTTVRVAAGSAAHVTPDRSPAAITEDAALNPGDVFVISDHGVVGATLEERAHLLVRAAA